MVVNSPKLHNNIYNLDFEIFDKNPCMYLSLQKTAMKTRNHRLCSNHGLCLGS